VDTGGDGDFWNPEISETRQTEARAAERGKSGAAQPNGTAPTSHLVRLKDYYMTPSSLEVNIGDMVVWGETTRNPVCLS